MALFDRLGCYTLFKLRRMKPILLRDIKICIANQIRPFPFQGKVMDKLHAPYIQSSTVKLSRREEMATKPVFIFFAQ